MARTRLTGTEVGDGTITGDDIDESTVDASLIPFVDPSFGSTNIKAAIVEAASPSNFHIIPEGGVMKVNENRQEINYGGLEIYGCLEIFGSLVFI